MELLVMDPESARLRLTSELSLDRFNLPSMGPLLGEALKRRQDLVAAARRLSQRARHCPYQNAS